MELLIEFYFTDWDVTAEMLLQTVKELDDESKGQFVHT